MNASVSRGCCSSLHVLLAALYLLLSLAAPLCVVMHEGVPTSPPHHPHAGHQERSVHASVCGWVCQTNSVASVVPLAPSMGLQVMAGIIPAMGAVTYSVAQPHRPPCRAPPRA